MTESKVIKKNLELHEQEAENYDEEKSEIYNEKEQERIRSVISEANQYIDTESSGMRALDIGCGTGNMIDKLKSRFNQVLGIDLSEDMLSEAKSKYSEEGLKFVRAKASSLPFEDNNFDFITAYSILHHLPDFSEPISEMFRVLKDGGVIYIDHEPINREKFFVKSYIKACDVLNGESNEGLPPYDETEEREYGDYHIHHGEEKGVPTSKITDLCEYEGFKIIKTREYLPYGTEVKNPLHPVFKHLVDSEWLLIGKKPN